MCFNAWDIKQAYIYFTFIFCVTIHIGLNYYYFVDDINFDYQQ